MEEYKATRLLPYLEKFDKYLEKHAKDSGYAIGNKLTYADLALFNAWNKISNEKEIGLKEHLSRLPHLKAHYEKVGANEKLKAWLDKRPNTPL